MPERVSLLRQCARSAMAAVLPRSLFMTRGPSTSQALYLTFDDGPHPEHTPRLLDFMAKQSIKGTFFLVGEKAEQYPRIVERIVAEGHGIGNHTWSHVDPRTVSDSALVNEITKTNQLLSGITGIAPTFFRPPFGKLTWNKFWAVWRAGFTVTLWNVDTKDYSSNDAQATIQRMNFWQPAAGDVVLLHDVYPQIHATFELLLALIRSRQPSLQFRALSNSLTR